MQNIIMLPIQRAQFLAQCETYKELHKHLNLQLLEQQRKVERRARSRQEIMNWQQNVYEQAFLSYFMQYNSPQQDDNQLQNFIQLQDCIAQSAIPAQDDNPVLHYFMQPTSPQQNDDLPDFFMQPALSQQNEYISQNYLMGSAVPQHNNPSQLSVTVLTLPGEYSIDPTSVLLPSAVLDGHRGEQVLLLDQLPDSFSSHDGYQQVAADHASLQEIPAQFLDPDVDFDSDLDSDSDKLIIDTDYESDANFSETEEELFIYN